MSHKLVKFSGQSLDAASEFDYGKVFEREENVIVIGASQGQCELMVRLSQLLSVPLYFLYVLMNPRCSSEAGRYQSDLFDDRAMVSQFLYDFQTFFETDGRHHLWLGTVDGASLLVYDNHNVIYAYGELDLFESSLIDAGFRKGKVSYPEPHAHHFHSENDVEEERLMQSLNWKWFPLETHD